MKPPPEDDIIADDDNDLDNLSDEDIDAQLKSLSDDSILNNDDLDIFIPDEEV